MGPRRGESVALRTEPAWPTRFGTLYRSCKQQAPGEGEGKGACQLLGSVPGACPPSHHPPPGWA